MDESTRVPDLRRGLASLENSKAESIIPIDIRGRSTIDIGGDRSCRAVRIAM